MKNLKQPTGNRLHQFYTTHRTYQALQTYKENPESYKFHRYKEGKWEGPRTNNFYAECIGAFIDIFGKPALQVYSHIALDSNEEVANTGYNGIVLYVHTHITGHVSDISYQFRIKRGTRVEIVHESIPVKDMGNTVLNKQSIIKFCIQHVKQKHFWPEATIWYKIQIHYQCDKQTAIEIYKRLKNAIYQEDYISDDWIRGAIKRKYNVEDPNYLIFDPDNLAKVARIFVERHGKPKHTHTIAHIPFPDSSSFDGDIDELEEYFHDEVDRLPKHTILI